jgi:hypothetical protein
MGDVYQRMDFKKVKFRVQTGLSDTRIKSLKTLLM